MYLSDFLVHESKFLFSLHPSPSHNFESSWFFVFFIISWWILTLLENRLWILIHRELSFPSWWDRPEYAHDSAVVVQEIGNATFLQFDGNLLNLDDLAKYRKVFIANNKYVYQSDLVQPNSRIDRRVSHALCCWHPFLRRVGWLFYRRCLLWLQPFSSTIPFPLFPNRIIPSLSWPSVVTNRWSLACFWVWRAVPFSFMWHSPVIQTVRSFSSSLRPSSTLFS